MPNQLVRALIDLPMTTRSRAPDWWKRALLDGKDCERKRRERYYQEYLEDATLALLPGELDGPFRLLYRMGFRLGYDNAKAARARENTFLPRPKRHAKLAK